MAGGSLITEAELDLWEAQCGGAYRGTHSEFSGKLIEDVVPRLIAALRVSRIKVEVGRRRTTVDADMRWERKRLAFTVMSAYNDMCNGELVWAADELRRASGWAELIYRDPERAYLRAPESVEL